LLWKCPRNLVAKSSKKYRLYAEELMVVRFVSDLFLNISSKLDRQNVF